MKYTTDEGLRKLRAIAERAYVRGSDTCKVSPIALLAVLDEIKAAQQERAADLPETWEENEHPSACIHRKACIFYQPAIR